MNILRGKIVLDDRADQPAPTPHGRYKCPRPGYFGLQGDAQCVVRLGLQSGAKDNHSAGGILKPKPNALGEIIRRFDAMNFHIQSANCPISHFRRFCNHPRHGKLMVGPLEIKFGKLRFEEGKKHGCLSARAAAGWSATPL
jgi:hypothetical protein